MTRHENISCPQQTIKATLGGGLRYINQTISLARRRVIHVQRVAALRDLISAVCYSF
jgi:hypothetical protein